MATFTWTNTTSLPDNWTDNTAWSPAAATGNYHDGTSDFLIEQGAGTITGFGGGFSIGSLTIDDSGITANFGAGEMLFSQGVTLFAGTISANVDGAYLASTSYVIGAAGVLVMGGATQSSQGSTLTGDPNASMSGSGIVVASSGYSDISSSVSVVAGSSLQFQITSGALLAFDGTVGNSTTSAGTITFEANSGVLLLDGSQVDNGTHVTNGGTFGATIAGLPVGVGPGNGIDIQASGLTAALSGTDNDVLTVTDGSGDHFVFNLSGDYTNFTAATQADTNNGGFDVFLQSVCYGAGTSVLTDHGEIAIETLVPGDTVMTLTDGVLVPRTITWVGHRDLVLGLHPKPEQISPVRIMRGALGENQPHRDLILSPDHCLFIDGGLYPAKLLINDMTIVRDMSMKAVSYYHLELDRHAVMIAEGVAAETYLDTGNRAFFSNAGLATILHPELNINENLRCWETDACAPLVARPELVKPVWQRFVDRAAELGYSAPVHTTTRDAGIHLMVDGQALRPLVTNGKTISFMVPGNATSIRLVSRATRQSALTPWLDDPRTLGVAIRSITLRDRTGELVLGADHPALRDGWHAVEHAADGAMWRWTVGSAALPFKAVGPCMVEIALSETATYIESVQRLAA